MIIGIDLDDVLAQSLEAIIEYHNETYGSALHRNDFVSDKYWEVWGGTKKTATEKWYDFYQTDYFNRIKPRTDAQKILSQLDPEHELRIVTGRPTETTKITELWLKRHFSNNFLQLHFVNLFPKDGSSGGKKSNICLEHNIEIIIDDSLGNIFDCAPHVQKCFLMDMPWNQTSTLPKNTKRITDWHELSETLTINNNKNELWYDNRYEK